MKQTLYILSLLLFFYSKIFSQDYQEYYFKFEITDKSEIDTITQIISIDNVIGLDVFAYANQGELDNFQKLGYKIVFLQKDTPKLITMATTIAEMSSWDRYPTYPVYRQLMKNFELNYPSICKLDSIGTTNNGRKLYVLKISDNVNIEENEPEFLYTSTIHGDEATGFILMLRLADSILTSYNSQADITKLVNEIEIYINPNANPDGTYYGGDYTVSSARRYNANGVDLNRDFPDPRTGPNSPYQIETQIMMNFAEEHNFVMSANFHGGAEVMNYPWDTWTSSQNSHSDTDWFEHICTDYVSSARTVLSSYMTSVTSDGVTEGGDWYVINGGRQDYMSFWHQCREVTIEISNSKLLAVESLNKYWNYNKISFLNYINECLYGIRGTVKSVETFPLDAKIWVINHDSNGDSSMVFTDPDIGDYHRLIAPGTYDIVASSDGYISDTAKNIVVTSDNVVWLNFELVSNDDSISLKTNPSIINDTLYYNQINTQNLIIYNDSSASNTNYSLTIENESENTWIELNKYSGTLSGKENDTVIVSFNSDFLNAGYFSTNIILTSADLKTDTIPVQIVVKDTISTYIQPEIIVDTLWGGENSEYEIIISNDGLISLNYTLNIENESSNEWISLNKQSDDLLITESDTVKVSVTTQGAGFGDFNCKIIVQKENSSNDTIPVIIYVKDTISVQINPESINDTLWSGDLETYKIFITNNGLKSVNYSLQIENEESNNWISLNKQSGSILSTQHDTIEVSVLIDNYNYGNFDCNIIIQKENLLNDTIPVKLFVKDIIAFEINPASITDTINQDTSKLYPIVITNTGHGALEYSSLIAFPTKSASWITLTNAEGTIQPGLNDTIFALVNTTDLVSDNYICSLIMSENSGKDQYIPIEIFVNPLLSIEQILKISEIKLYPNPFNDQINLEFYAAGSYSVNLSIYSICGNAIFEKELSILNHERNNIDLNDLFNIKDLPCGIYFIQLSTSNYKITNKIIKN